MLYQNSYGVLREVKKYGCYMVCFMNAHSFQRGKNSYRVEDLNEIYYKALDSKIIESNCFVNDAYRFCRNVLDWRVKDIKKVDKDYDPLENEIAIWLMRRYAPGNSEAELDGFIYHFVLNSRYGSLYDPISIGSLTAQIGELHTQRIIVLDEEAKV